jgi:putative endonuclease
MDRAALGRDGEQRAVELLRKGGYTILARNYRRRAGEIDIVAFEAGEIVFVEVKTRDSDEKGTALEAVTPRKRRTITRVAQQFLVERGLEDRPCRFDVVAISSPAGKGGDTVVRGAFGIDT